MVEYIEREEATNVACNILWKMNDLSTSVMAKALNSIPAADVVPVVRCEDCEYFGPNDENVPYCFNRFGLNDPEPNGFCNYGIGKN